MCELRAMQNKDKIYAPEEFTLHGAFFCLLFYGATARHEQDTKCLRMASRIVAASTIFIDIVQMLCYLLMIDTRFIIVFYFSLTAIKVISNAVNQIRWVE